ncbi:MAG TPA: hypothetical protein VFP76_02790 [Gemmatimonadota bacterium]|nr:hypothetical protein [Gemmatimonadota bacterium]
MAAAVMPDVQKTGSQRVGQAGGQRRLARLPQVAGQQEPARPRAHEEHGRRLVGRPSPGVRIDGHPVGRWMEDVDRHRSLAEPPAGAQGHRPRSIPGHGRQEREPRRVVVHRHRAPQLADLHPPHHARRASHVVEVGMRDDQPVQPRHTAPAQVREDDAPAGVAERIRGSGVDQPGRPVGEVDHDGVTLPDVQPADLPAPERARRRRK